MKRRPSADAFFLIGLLLIFAMLSFQISARTPGDRGNEEISPRRTTYSNRPGGWKAFYEVLQSSNLPVQRWTRPPSAWPEAAQVVICGTDYQSMNGGSPWSDKETEDALKWVDAGGTLILLINQDNALTEALHLSLTDAHITASEDNSSLALRQPFVFLHGVSTIAPYDETRWKESPSSSIGLFADKNPAAVLFAHGDGYVIAVSSAAIADNEHLGKSDNARFLVQTVAAFCGTGKGDGKAGPILFDEYHQGYDDQETLWTAIGRPGQLIAYELLVLALLIAYTASRRFGLPSPPPTASRVSSEYVRSLADLYRRAGAADAALDSLYGSFRRDLCRALAIPADAPVAEVAQTAAISLAAGNKDVKHRLEQIMDMCEAKISGGPRAVADGELLQTARSLESLRKELHLGGIAPDA